MGQTSEEGRGGEEIRTDAGVLGGRGMVEIVRKPGERLTALFFRFVKQEPLGQWFSDVSYQAVGGLCMGTGWWWKYWLTEEERRRTVRSRWAMIASR